MIEVSKSEQWADRIAAWEGSGLSRRVWCGQHGVNVHTLDYWRRRLQCKSAPRVGQTDRPLVPIVVSAVAGSVPLQVWLPGGVQVHITCDADVAQAAQLVRALHGC